MDASTRRGDYSIAACDALDPAYRPPHEWYGVSLIEQGDVRAAFAQLQIAGDLDPLSVSTSAWLGNAAYLDRHFNKAIAYSRQALDLSPQSTDALTTIGEAYEAEGNYSRAIEAYKQYATTCSGICPAESAALSPRLCKQHRMPAARAQLAFAMSTRATSKRWTSPRQPQPWAIVHRARASAAYARPLCVDVG